MAALALAPSAAAAGPTATFPEKPVKAQLTAARATELFVADDKVADWLSRYPMKGRTTEATYEGKPSKCPAGARGGCWTVKISWGGAGETYVGMEFPLIQWTAGILFRAFGERDVIIADVRREPLPHRAHAIRGRLRPDVLHGSAILAARYDDQSNGPSFVLGSNPVAVPRAPEVAHDVTWRRSAAGSARTPHQEWMRPSTAAVTTNPPAYSNPRNCAHEVSPSATSVGPSGVASTASYTFA